MERQSPLFGRFSCFFIDYQKVWSSGRHWVIRLYLKMLQKFFRLILKDGLRVVHLSLVRKVKFKFLAEFSVDHFPYPVVSSLILFFVLICCILLLYDWSFRLDHQNLYLRYYYYYLFVMPKLVPDLPLPNSHFKLTLCQVLSAGRQRQIQPLWASPPFLSSKINLKKMVWFGFFV